MCGGLAGVAVARRTSRRPVGAGRQLIPRVFDRKLQRLEKVPITYLAPRRADPQQSTTCCLDHGLELFIVIGQTDAKDEGTDDIRGGLGQQHGRVEWTSWEA